MDGNFQLGRKPTAKEKQGIPVLAPLPNTVFLPSAGETALWGSNEEVKKYDKKIDSSKEVSVHKLI